MNFKYQPLKNSISSVSRIYTFIKHNCKEWIYSKTNLKSKKLQITHNNILRMILNRDNDYHVKNLFNELNVLSIKKLLHIISDFHSKKKSNKHNPTTKTQDLNKTIH